MNVSTYARFCRIRASASGLDQTDTGDIQDLASQDNVSGANILKEDVIVPQQ